MNCETLEECLRQINFYLASKIVAAPLIVNAENFRDYQRLREILPTTCKVVRLSDYAEKDTLPRVEDLFSDISASGNFAVLGLSQFFMLQGQRAVENLIASLVNLNTMKGRVIILVFRCSEFITSYTLRNPRAENWTLLLNSAKSPLTELRLIKYRDFADGDFCEGFQEMLYALETPSENCQVLTVYTTFSPELFMNSIYPVSSVTNPYEEVIKKFPELSFMANYPDEFYRCGKITTTGTESENAENLFELPSGKISGSKISCETVEKSSEKICGQSKIGGEDGKKLSEFSGRLSLLNTSTINNMGNDEVNSSKADDIERNAKNLSDSSIDYAEKFLSCHSENSGASEKIQTFSQSIYGKISESCGTDEEWLYLFKLSKGYSRFSELVFHCFGPPEIFPKIMPVIFSLNSEHEKWLFWLSMKIFYSCKNDYLALALSETQNYKQLIHKIYFAILSIPVSDVRFKQFFSERKFFIQNLPENLTEILAYLEHFLNLGKSAVYYLTDTYENEEYEFLRLIAEGDYSEQEVYDAAKNSFPELALYLNDFDFNEKNTQLREKDSAFREVLRKYFHAYKLQKITNRITPEFLSQVDQLAVEHSFYKLQPRSSLLQKFKADGVQAYFFDALGVEFLGYIEAKCKEYGLKCEIEICRCNLPSITSCNNEFKNDFDVRSISSLDELKHDSAKFNYQRSKYPLYVFSELRIIDRELRKIAAELSRKNFTKALIISDHGTSRLVLLNNNDDDENFGVFTKIRTQEVCSKKNARFISIGSLGDKRIFLHSRFFASALTSSSYIVLSNYGIINNHSRLKKIGRAHV